MTYASMKLKDLTPEMRKRIERLAWSVWCGIAGDLATSYNYSCHLDGLPRITQLPRDQVIETVLDGGNLLMWARDGEEKDAAEACYSLSYKEMQQLLAESPSFKYEVFEV